MIRNLFAMVLMLLLMTLWITAQTTTSGPLSTTSVLMWAAPSNVTSPAEAATLEYRLYVDSDTQFTVLANKTCGAPVASDLIATCQQPVPSSVLPALNAIGSHTVRLTAYSASANMESDKSLPFVLRTPPDAPMNLRTTK